MQRQIRRLHSSYALFKTKTHVIVRRMMQKNYSEDGRVTKLQVHRLVSRFQQTGSVEDCQHNNSGNFKKRLNLIKEQNEGHIADLVLILIVEILSFLS